MWMTEHEDYLYSIWKLVALLCHRWVNTKVGGECLESHIHIQVLALGYAYLFRMFNIKSLTLCLVKSVTYYTYYVKQYVIKWTSKLYTSRNQGLLTVCVEFIYLFIQFQIEVGHVLAFIWYIICMQKLRCPQGVLYAIDIIYL